MEFARDTNRHVKRTLPPSLSGIPGTAEIRYYIKVTVVRPKFYQENHRSVRPILNTHRLSISRCFFFEIHIYNKHVGGQNLRLCSVAPAIELHLLPHRTSAASGL